MQGFRQLRDCSPEQLQETTRGFRLYNLESYWASLKPSFNAVTIYLEHEEWLDEVIEPVARSYGDSWIVLGNDSSSAWLKSEEGIKSIEPSGRPARNGISAGLRFRILRRDGFRCSYCGRSPRNDGVRLHVDHMKPRVAGGSNEENNLVAACRDCNLGKRKSAVGTI